MLYQLKYIRIMKTTSKYFLLSIICWWFVSCNNAGKQSTNQLIQNNFNKISLSDYVENRKNIVGFNQPSTFKAFDLQELNDLAINYIQKNIVGFFGKEFFPFAIKSDVLNEKNSKNISNPKDEGILINPEIVTDKVINYRKNRHFTQVKFNHYDRYLVSTKAKDFTTDEVWATITDFHSARLN